MTAYMRNLMVAFTAGVALVSGCSDKTIVNPVSQPTTEALSGDLTPAGIQTLSLGVLAADRQLIRGDFLYLTLSPILSRDAYRIDPNEPRYVSETLGGFADPGSFSGS